MSHDCVKQLNQQLGAHNTQIATALSFSDPSRELIHIQTIKADTKMRGKPVSLFATYCPFCGVKLKEQA